MRTRSRLLLAVAGVALVSTSVAAQQTAAPATPAATGKELLQRKCFQCHQIGMWNPLRQERRAWEAVLYRMVGRGALWTPEEISAMAEYLAEIRGATKAASEVRK